MTIVQKTRSVSIFCAEGISRHNYCLEGNGRTCECTCHSVEHFGEADMLNLAYQLWTIRDSFALFSENERHQRLLDLVLVSEDTLAWHGLSPDRLVALLELTLERPYWSRRETEEDFGLTAF